MNTDEGIAKLRRMMKEDEERWAEHQRYFARQERQMKWIASLGFAAAVVIVVLRLMGELP